MSSTNKQSWNTGSAGETFVSKDASGDEHYGAMHQNAEARGAKRERRQLRTATTRGALE